MKTIEKIKNKIREFNKNNLLFYIASWILAFIIIFILLTTIMQCRWIGIELDMPVLIWMISAPFVGIFFLPFILLLIYVCWFIVAVAKPVTIQKVKNDTRTLFENNDLEKQQYEIIYNELNDADYKQQQKKQQINNEASKIISDIKQNFDLKELKGNEKNI